MATVCTKCGAIDSFKDYGAAHLPDVYVYCDCCDDTIPIKELHVASLYDYVMSEMEERDLARLLVYCEARDRYNPDKQCMDEVGVVLSERWRTTLLPDDVFSSREAAVSAATGVLLGKYDAKRLKRLMD